jgi:hypothetical protein
MAHKRSLSLLPCTSEGVSFIELRQSFPSQIQAISPFVDQLMQFVTRSRSMDGSEMDIEAALREALENAIIHGNREDAHKRVSVTCRCTAEGEVRQRAASQRPARLGRLHPAMTGRFGPRRGIHSCPYWDSALLS